MDLLEKASIILTPTAYNNGEALCVKPTDGSGDFDFSRNSAATRVNAQGLVENVQILSSNLVQNGDFSELGSEEVSNGSFTNGETDWEFEGSWSIAEDKASYDAIATSQNIRQGIAFQSGRNYKITFTVSDVDELGGKQAYFALWTLSNGSERVFSYTKFNNGSYTFYYTAASGSLIYFNALNSSNGGAFSLTNISVKELDPNDYWSLETGWSIGNDVATCDGTNAVSIQQPLSTVNTKLKKITFTVSNYVSGTVRFYSGAGADILYEVSENGTFTYYDYLIFNKIFIYSSSSFNGSVTDISIIEISSDTNLPRINYEGFSYQDALGSEEIVNGDFSDGGANWLFAGGAEATEQGARINNTITGTNSFIKQSNSNFTIGKSFVLEYDVVATNGTTLAIEQSSAITLNTSTIGNNRKINFQWDIASTGLVIKRLTTGTDVTITNVSVKEYLGQEVVPDSGCGSWLFEPQSTNLIEYSNDYADAYWTVKANSSISSNAIISPDGNLNADKLVENTSSSTHYINKNSFVLISGVDYTYSVFAKAGERSSFWLRTINGVGDAYFDLSNGTITSGVGGFIEDYGNGWYRCSVSGTSTSTTGNPYIYLVKSGTTTNYLGDGTSGLYIYGFQVEQGNISSYIPTSGSQVTRNQDLCTNGGSLASINSTEGVLYAEIAALANDGTYRRIALSDNTSSNAIFIGYTATSNQIQCYITSSGVGEVSFLYILDNALDFNKIAIRYKDDDFSFWVDGVQVLTDTSGNAPIGLSELAFDRGSGSSEFFGKTKALAVFPYLTDQELTELTTI